MILAETPCGDFHDPPYTGEECYEFEPHLRRGGGITIIRGSKRKADKDNAEPSDQRKERRIAPSPHDERMPGKCPSRRHQLRLERQ